MVGREGMGEESASARKYTEFVFGSSESRHVCRYAEVLLRCGVIGVFLGRNFIQR